MFDRDVLKRMAAMRQDWEEHELRDFLERQPESRSDCRTGSGLPTKRVYTPEDIADTPCEEIGLPGRYPFTRGPYPTMYRGRVWTMRQIAIEIHRLDPDSEARQLRRLQTIKMTRDNARVERLLSQLAECAADASKNLMPPTIELVKARASMGEIVQRLKAVCGSYVEAPVF